MKGLDLGKALEELAHGWFEVKLQVATEIMDHWKEIALWTIALAALVWMWVSL